MARGGARPGAGRRKGTPNKATADVKEAASVYSADAVETLAQIMRSTSLPAAARVAAANALLDRAHGKPKQSVDVDGAMTGALTVTYVSAAKGPAPAQSEEDYETGE
ncbi:hypothetical protein [Brevundimonas sp. FT23028]|uniref:hypothetical protein n=1 Tax=Brevundimonas sp. FT23028 TaxID=3393748 RepID=UPI003B5897D2